MAFPFQVETYTGSSDDDGVPNSDSQSIKPEATVKFPGSLSPANSWISYRPVLEVSLDAGFILNKPLPQNASQADDLGTIDWNADLDGADEDENGINIGPKVQVTDFIQQMATSTYIFTLKGDALRVGYQVPIPFIESIDDANGDSFAVTPYGEQIASNVLIGSLLGGVPIYYAYWNKSYMMAQTPAATENYLNAPIPANFAAQVTSDADLPLIIDVPTTVPDANAVPSIGQPELLIPIGIPYQ